MYKKDLFLQCTAYRHAETTLTFKTCTGYGFGSRTLPMTLIPTSTGAVITSTVLLFYWGLEGLH